MRVYRPDITAFSAVLMMLLLSACTAAPPAGPGNEEISKPRAATSNVLVRELEREKQNDVGIIWEAGDRDIEAFLIRFGSDPDRLLQEKQVDVDQVEKYVDPEYGTVYRYLLRDAPPGRSLFVSISSITRHGVSSPSPVFQVIPGDKP